METHFIVLQGYHLGYFLLVKHLTLFSILHFLMLYVYLLVHCSVDGLYCNSSQNNTLCQNSGVLRITTLPPPQLPAQPPYVWSNPSPIHSPYVTPLPPHHILTNTHERSRALPVWWATTCEGAMWLPANHRAHLTPLEHIITQSHLWQLWSALGWTVSKGELAMGFSSLPHGGPMLRGGSALSLKSPTVAIDHQDGVGSSPGASIGMSW